MAHQDVPGTQGRADLRRIMPGVPGKDKIGMAW
jgi:hypothetical protein